MNITWERGGGWGGEKLESSCYLDANQAKPTSADLLDQAHVNFQIQIMENAQHSKTIAFHSYPTLPCLLAF